MPASDDAGEVSTSPPMNKRQRTKQACEPCRLRKRKCDGSMPCNMCAQFEYKCYFEKHPRKRSRLVEQSSQATITASPENHDTIDRANPEELSKLRSMEANSGIAFTRLLGLRLDPSAGPKLFTFGWNLGSLDMGMSSCLLPRLPQITELLSEAQYLALSELFFENVHPLYGIIDKDWLLKNTKFRWTNPESCKVPDHLISVVAALGTLFTDGPVQDVVPKLVELQKLTLENVSMSRPCTFIDVQSWAFRSLYLRATGHPHAVHMASCVTIHMAEAIGLHQETSSEVLYQPESDLCADPEVRRRTFWVIRLLNSWVSFEYGRTRVMLRGITTKLPTPREGDYTTDYIELYTISCCLDPEVSDRAGQWEEFLRRIEAYEPPHDGIALSKANLALCGYRRLRLANPNLSSEILSRIINMGLEGLAGAKRMAEKGLAWWHVANVPFQVICVFLAMDVRESLSHVGTAMRTLEFIVERFRTVTMKEVLKTARFLVRLSKKRKDEDSDVLGQSLLRNGKGIDESDPQPENLRTDPMKAQMASFVATDQVQVNVSPATETPGTGASMDDWTMDLLDDSQFDWNIFLANEMPTFTDLRPDGSM